MKPLSANAGMRRRRSCDCRGVCFACQWGAKRIRCGQNNCEHPSGNTPASSSHGHVDHGTIVRRPETNETGAETTFEKFPDIARHRDFTAIFVAINRDKRQNTTEYFCQQLIAATVGRLRTRNLRLQPCQPLFSCITVWKKTCHSSPENDLKPANFLHQLGYRRIGVLRLPTEEPRSKKKHFSLLPLRRPHWCFTWKVSLSTKTLASIVSRRPWISAASRGRCSHAPPPCKLSFLKRLFSGIRPPPPTAITHFRGESVVDLQQLRVSEAVHTPLVLSATSWIFT